MKRTLLIALIILLAAAAGLGAWRWREARKAPPEPPETAAAEEVPCGPAGAPAESKPAPKPLLGGGDEPGCEKTAAKPGDPFALPAAAIPQPFQP